MVKEELACSSAELVFGTTLRLPSQFVAPIRTKLDPGDYVSRLKQHMSSCKLTLTRAQQGSTYVPKELFKSSHVFIRDDMVRKPLQQPYKGPFKVLKRNEKYFTVDINGKRKQVIVNRLKVAHVEEHGDDDTTAEVKSPNAHIPAAGSSAANAAPAPRSDTTVPPVRKTRSGRHVHWPKRYVEYRVFSWICKIHMYTGRTVG